MCVLLLGPGVNSAPHFPFLLPCMSAKKIYKNIKWNSNVAGAPIRNETKMAFVCACVCKEKVCACAMLRAPVCGACVCVLWGEMVNYLQSQAPETATTVLGRARASGKQPSSLFLPSLPLFPVSFLLLSPFSPSIGLQCITADSRTCSFAWCPWLLVKLSYSNSDF